MIFSFTEFGVLLAAGLLESAGAFWEFLRVGGFFMLLIGLTSIVSIAVIIYKFITLNRARTLPTVVEEQLQHCEDWAVENRFHELAPWLKQHPSTASNIGVFALESDFTDREEARNAVQSHAREEMVKLERGVAVLEVIITIAPLMGLLGTVAGLVSVFGNLGEASSSNDYSLIAKGISEALGTTIAGLVVAVPAVIAHSYFSKQLEALAVRMEVLVGHLINVRYRAGGRTRVKKENIATEDLLEFDADDSATGLLNPAN
ncbi:MAG: MotA/TolQ/ExbB proton channel family protein [Verrucomicrobiota bacterium]